jgi:Lrp/AsnC family transcriptional regulator, leucine-responsive regulatory protein
MAVKTKALLNDRKNVELLKLLQRDPRTTVAELARRVGMSGPAVKERVLRLEESGIIEAYRLALSPKALGYGVMALIRMRPMSGRTAKVTALVKSMPEVTECHRVTGEDCFVLKVYVKEMAQLERLVDQLLLHGDTTTSIVQSTPIPPRSLPINDA